MALSVKPALRLLPITAGPGLLEPRPRALYVSADGTITIATDDNTATADIPVFAGATLPLSPARLTAGTGIYGYYD